MKRTIYLNFIIIFFLVQLLYACERKPEISPSGITLKIGVITPLSGDHKTSGESGLEGIKVAQQVRTFLDNGDKIELIIEDDQSTPDKALMALEKLATKDNVSAVLILSPSEIAIAVSKVADKYQTPILSTIATSPEVTKYSNFVSQLSFDDTFQAMAAALYARDELLIEKAAVFSHPDNPHFSYLGKEFIDKFQSVGGVITDSIFVTADTENLTNILEKVSHNKPTLLYVPVDTKIVLQISKYVKSVEWDPIILGTDGLLADILTEYSDDLHLLDDMIATDLYYDDMKLTSYGKKLEKVIALKKIDANTNSAVAMEAYSVLLKAMNRCDPPVTRECINKKVRSTRNFEGVMGYISIDSNGKSHRPLIINSLEGGYLNFMVKVY